MVFLVFVKRGMERKMGLEPTTFTMARYCSTVELHPRNDYLSSIVAFFDFIDSLTTKVAIARSNMPPL